MQDCNAQSQALAASSGRKKRRTDGEAAGGRGKLTLFDKYSMIMRLETDESFKQIHASKMYNISPAAVNQMVKRKQRIIHDYEFGLNPYSKRVSCLKSNMKILDERLMLYVLDRKKEGQNVLSNTQLIWEKAESIAAELQLLENNGNGPNLWKPNRGWWFRFKNRVSSLVVPNFENTDLLRNAMAALDDPKGLDMPIRIDGLQQYDFQLLDASSTNYLPLNLDMPQTSKRSYQNYDSYRTCSYGDSTMFVSVCPENLFDHDFVLDSVDQVVAT